MTPEQAFSVLNLMALLAWVAMIALPRLRWTSTQLPIVMPLVFGIVYAAIVSATLGPGDLNFSSLAAVSTLFANPWVLLAGWTHYLAFDLFVGGWEVRDAQQRGIHHLLIVPALVLTFMLGPAGLLLYFVIRRFAPARPA